MPAYLLGCGVLVEVHGKVLNGDEHPFHKRAGLQTESPTPSLDPRTAEGCPHMYCCAAISMVILRAKTFLVDSATRRAYFEQFGSNAEYP